MEMNAIKCNRNCGKIVEYTMEKNAAFITSKYATSDGMHPVIKKVFC
jgi:hypothetical protein